MTQHEQIQAAYDKGFRDGLAAYAINKDGKQLVGDPPVELKLAQAAAPQTWNYFPPSRGY